MPNARPPQHPYFKGRIFNKSIERVLYLELCYKHNPDTYVIIVALLCCQGNDTKHQKPYHRDH